MISLEDQAQLAANHIKHAGIKVLYLYPSRKSGNAHANQFRKLLLAYLTDQITRTCKYGIWITDVPSLEILTDAAQTIGYSINDVDMVDY